MGEHLKLKKIGNLLCDVSYETIEMKQMILVFKNYFLQIESSFQQYSFLSPRPLHVAVILHQLTSILYFFPRYWSQTNLTNHLGGHLNAIYEYFAHYRSSEVTLFSKDTFIYFWRHCCPRKPVKALNFTRSRILSRDDTICTSYCCHHCPQLNFPLQTPILGYLPEIVAFNIVVKLV